jgi:hypothetical protein
MLPKAPIYEETACHRVANSDSGFRIRLIAGMCRRPDKEKRRIIMANPSAPTPRNQPPVHDVRLGAIKAAIWQNPTDNGVRYSVSFERLYMQEGEWRSTGSFGRDDLLVLAKVADLAHSWIMDPERSGAAADRSGRGGDFAGQRRPGPKTG